ncbi:MAG: hypothetical protein ACJAWV_002408 [Flammeovirgaceae bacterium]|jgi:hypothetical protein
MTKSVQFLLPFLCFLGILFTQKAIGQDKKTEKSLRVWTENTKHNCAMGTIVKTVVHVQNISNNPVEFKVKRVKAKLSKNQESFFRLDSKITAARTNESQNTIILQPDDISSGFMAYFSTGFKKGENSLTYQFINTNSKDDFAEIKLNYRVSDKIPANRLYVNEQISISFMYPNPAVHFGEFEYRMPSLVKSKAKIAIHDVLGKKLGTYDLEPSEASVRIPFKNLNSGIYFYMLILDEETVATKKFVLKK